jgi:spore germination protein YaaH
MWLEDSHSMQKRIELMKKYRLAGIAAWRRGFEKEELWPLMTELLNKRW